jgi:DNA-binding MarR family transcriptional regulator
MATISMYGIGMSSTPTPGSRSPTPGFLVWRLSMRWRAAVDRAVAPLGLTHAQYSLLASLSGVQRQGRSPSQRELADTTGLDPIYVSKLCRALERSGLLARTSDPDDTRAVRLALTNDGRAVVQRAIRVVHDLLEQLTAPLGGLASDRTRAFMDDLTLLLDGSGTSNPQPDAGGAS